MAIMATQIQTGDLPSEPRILHCMEPRNVSCSLCPYDSLTDCTHSGSPIWRVCYLSPHVPVDADIRSSAELCFWLFLLNSSRSEANWFRSIYFKIWAGGSALAIIYMPLVTIFTRSNPLKVSTANVLRADAFLTLAQSEAWLFLAGSLGDLTLTVCSTPMMYAT